MVSYCDNCTVSHTGDYRIEAIGAVEGYDLHPNSAQERGRGAKMIGTFSLIKDEIMRILVGQEGGSEDHDWSSGGGGGTFVVRKYNTPLIIAGGGGGLYYLTKRHAGCDASTNTTGILGTDQQGQAESVVLAGRVAIPATQVRKFPGASRAGERNRRERGPLEKACSLLDTSPHSPLDFRETFWKAIGVLVSAAAFMKAYS